VDTDVASVAGGEVKIIDFSIYARLMMIFFFPVIFWWLSFLAYVGEFCVTSAGAIWFFSKDKNTLEYPILLSLKNLLSYHMGSVLWCCVIIPSMRTLKAVTGWLKG
jgi:hypothetical protein